jgi:hypothetical protein
MTEHKPPITPVMGACGCLGHIRPTAKGYVAYGRDDQYLGTFSDPAAAAALILKSGG